MAVNDYDPIIQQAGQEWNVDPLWLKSLMQQETGGSATKNGKPIRSSAGAGGLMQIMPGTAKNLGVEDVDDVRQNIFGGAKYASQMLDRYGNVPLATAAYNAGPDRVDAYLAGKGTLPAETMAYVPAVASHYAAFQNASGPAKSNPIPSDDDFLRQTGAVTKGSSTVSDSAASTPNPAANGGINGGIPSDEDFLKATGAVAPPLKSTISTNLAAPVGGEFGDLSAQPWAQGEQPLANVEAPAATLARNVGGAMAQAYRNTDAILTPQAQQAVDRWGPIGQQIVNPLFHALGAVPATMNALGTGGAALISAGANAAGVPALGRDLNMLAQVAPFAGMGTGVPRVAAEAPHPLASFRLADVPMISEDFRANPGVLTPQMKLSEGAPVSGNALNTRSVPSDPLSTTSASSETVNPLRDVPSATSATLDGPRSVGAAASRDMTPAGQIEMTTREMLVNRATAEQEKLNELQPQGLDTNRYVPGVNPTMAEMEQSVKTAREQKALSMISPEIADQARGVDVAHTEARQQYFKDVVGSKTELDRLDLERSAQASKDAEAAFKPGQTANAQPVADTIDSILERPRASENTQLQKYVAPLLDRLYEPDGSLKTNPEQLYGLREDLNRMRSRASQAQDKNLTHVSHELGDISDALDTAIAGAAPEYRTYMKNYADASRRIDELSVLQGHENGLNALKTFTPFQRMMKTIVEQRQAQGNNPYKSISDETMQKLWALRDDLRRSASAQDLAKARGGSDSVQNALDIAKNVAKVGIRAGVHYGLYHATSDLGANALLGIADMAATKKIHLRNVNRAHEMLNPNSLRYAPPSE